MLDVIRQIAANWAAIWTSPSAETFFAVYTAYAIGTVFLCMPAYLLVGLVWVMDVKGKTVQKLTATVLNWTVAVNLALAVAPIGIPILIAVVAVRGAWHLYRPAPARRANRRREREREETEEDEPET